MERRILGGRHDAPGRLLTAMRGIGEDNCGVVYVYLTRGAISRIQAYIIDVRRDTI